MNAAAPGEGLRARPVTPYDVGSLEKEARDARRLCFDPNDYGDED